MISTSYDIDDNQRNSSASNNDEESIFLSSSSEDEQLINNFTSRKNKDKKRYIAKVNDGNEVDEFSNESDASDLEIPLKREDDCISIDDDDDDDDDEYYDDEELNSINKNYLSYNRNCFTDTDDQSDDDSDETLAASSISKKKIKKISLSNNKFDELSSDDMNGDDDCKNKESKNLSSKKEEIVKTKMNKTIELEKSKISKKSAEPEKSKKNNLTIDTSKTKKQIDLVDLIDSSSTCSSPLNSPPLPPPPIKTSSNSKLQNKKEISNDSIKKNEKPKVKSNNDESNKNKQSKVLDTNSKSDVKSGKIINLSSGFKIPKRTSDESNGIDLPPEKKAKITTEESNKQHKTPLVKDNSLKQSKPLKQQESSQIKSVKPTSKQTTTVPASSNNNNNNNKTQPIVKPPPQPKIRNEIQESDAFMEALGNVSTTSRSLNKPTFNKNKIVKKESINESIKTPATTIIDEKPVSKHLNENNNVTSTDKINELKNENNLYKSNLAEPTLKKLNKKKVLWADTHTNGSKQLVIVQYFYLDEIEREIKRSALTDLKNGSDIGDIGAKIEKLNEKELKFKMSPTSFNNTNNTDNKNVNEIKNNWPSSLIPIDLPESIPKPEIKSIEHEIQLKREQNTLAVLVFKQFLPDSPSEPENENITNKTNPLDFYPTKIIPFDDSTLNVQSDMDNQIHYNPAKDCTNDKFYSKQQQQQQNRQQFQNEQSLLILNNDLVTPLNFRPDLTSYPDTPVSLVSTPTLTDSLNSFQVSATNKDSSNLMNSVSNETLKQILNTINNKKADSISPSSNTPATTPNLQDLFNRTKITSDINNGISNIDGFNRNDNQRKNSSNLNNFGVSKQFDNDEPKNSSLPKNSQKWNNNNHGWSKNNNGQRFFNKNDNNNSQQRNFQNNSVEIGSSSSNKDNSDDNSTNDINNRNIFLNKFKRGIGNRSDMNRPNNNNNNNNHFRQQTSEYNYKNTFQNKGNNNHKGNFRPDFNRNHFDNDKSSEPEVFNNNSNKNKESKNLTKNSNEFKSAGKWM